MPVQCGLSREEIRFLLHAFVCEAPAARQPMMDRAESALKRVERLLRLVAWDRRLRTMARQGKPQATRACSMACAGTIAR